MKFKCNRSITINNRVCKQKLRGFRITKNSYEVSALQKQKGGTYEVLKERPKAIIKAGFDYDTVI